MKKLSEEMKEELKNVSARDILGLVMEAFSQEFAPTKKEESWRRMTITTDRVIEILDDIAEFDKEEVARVMYFYGYEVSFERNTGDMAWVYYAPDEDID